MVESWLDDFERENSSKVRPCRNYYTKKEEYEKSMTNIERDKMENKKP